MENDNRNDDSFVLFELAGTTYAIRSSFVRQLEMIEHITPVPNTPASVEGVVFSRGQVTPAISVRTRFGLPKIDYDIRSRLIVVSVDDRTIGLIVDAAREFKRIPADVIKPPSESLGNMTGDYLEGIASIDDRMILVLKLDEVVKTADEVAASIEG